MRGKNYMKIGILSDIHGNITALTAVFADMLRNNVNSIMVLGDIIDYGPHSNEVIQLLEKFEGTVLCNIHGNHENAIVYNQYEKFSSDRGRVCAQYTRDNLTEKSWNYVERVMTNTGKKTILVKNKKVLAIHGSLEDNYWQAISIRSKLDEYWEYDYVFSGHSHLPHMFEIYYKKDDPIHRNKKKTVFVNPGSVGQPRNLCACAQYTIWETENDTFEMKKISYDIRKEQRDFSDKVDVFYKNRLEVGI